MRKYYYIILFMLLIPLASADLNDGLRAYYKLNDNAANTNVVDSTGNYTSTTASSNTNTWSATGLLNESFTWDGTSDVYTAAAALGNFGNGSFTISMWIKNVSGWQDGNMIHKYTGTGVKGYYIKTLNAGGTIRFAMFDGAVNYVDSNVTANGDGSWNHILGLRNETYYDIYVNGVHAGRDTGLSTTSLDSAVLLNFGEQSHTSGLHYKGGIDEIGIWERALTTSEIADLYNSGAGLQYEDFAGGGGGNATPTASERLQQDSSIEQNASVNINSVTYVPVMSSSITISDDTFLYGSATIPITPTASNTATCRLTIDGAELNETETSRTLTAGSAANMLITSLEHYTAAGTYDFGLECLRVGGGAYDVANASILLHILTTPAGVQLETAQLNLSSAGLPGLLGSTTITTSDNVTASGLNRYLVTEWAANYNYNATGNISLVTELAGTNCTEVKRYGSIGSTGSVGGVCYVGVGNETNSTAYDFKVYGSGSGSVSNAKFHVKEFILHDGEINQTGLNGLTGNGTIATTTINVNGGHSTPDLIGQSILSVTANPTTTGTFYLNADSQNSTFVARTSSAGQPGVLGVHKDFETITGAVTLSLVGDCANCTFTGQNLLGYISSDVAATPNEFVVSSDTTYGASINEFSINLSDGRSFSTTTGSISVPATGQLLNISAVENAGAAVPYFANFTAAVDHNSTFDITLNLTPYTLFNASYEGSGVNNFTLNGTTTTSGQVYVRLYNTTDEFTISNAVSAGGVNLSDQSANVTASPYLESYTFVMLTANAFNFSIYDELTEALVTENMTIELIAGASAGTYTTTNGTLYLDLLTPSDYTIRYYSTIGSNYTQRDYIQTLTDRQRYEISLYSILNDEATDMVVTIQDTSSDPVEGAIVKLLRYYTSCNCYNVVEMATTSVAGSAYFVVDAYDGHYKFAVEYNGETEFLSTSPENFIPTNGLVTRTITINLGSAYFQSFRALTDVARVLTYNNDTKGLSFTWNDPSGLVTQGCLYAEYLEGVHYTAVTPVCQTGATGSVVITLNNSANSYKYYAELETSTTYSDYVVFSGVIDKIRDNLLAGNVGLGAFLAAGVMAVLALMFSFSAIAVMIITAVGVVVMSFLGFATIATAFITGFVTLIIGLAAYLMRS